ncbi:MAG: transketolase [Spirochaetales bacterium]|nr:transketolase [Spirochaetales bacterium]
MNTQGIQAAATSVRTLSMDAVQKANSGHPGLPMGCAELGVLLYGEIMKHQPSDPGWIDRDRFVLSAGHGSILLYSLLFLSGYDLTLEDLKNFRQLGSKTAGHPEYGLIPGIETTTGPLGAGFSNAVGMAMAEQMLAARFNTAGRTIIDHYTWALAGDGCMMEGITAEAASLAGHLKLGKLIVFYDSNRISIEGSTDLAFTEYVEGRFEAYGWQTLSCDAYDLPALMYMVKQAKADTERPTLIKVNSVIGQGSPNKAGSHSVHGAPLGEDEVKATRKALGMPEDEAFCIAPGTEDYFAERRKTLAKTYEAWQAEYAAWRKADPASAALLDRFLDGKADFSTLKMPAFETGSSLATRAASGKVLQALSAALPNLVGGSADLAPSNNTFVSGAGEFSAQDRTGRNLHFGVREHAMGGILNGLALHGGLRVYGGTFLVFSDYMRPAVRLAALMGLPVVYVFTHDSIFVGEDGPTHQPIEHVTALRIIPNLQVLRPADAEETAEAWKMALERTDGPTALILTRQNLPVSEKADPAWKETLRKGAYVLRDCDGTPDVVAVASGSEVALALAATEKAEGRKVRVVSVLSRELFFRQDKAFCDKLLPPGVPVVAAEAGVTLGWEGVTGRRENILGIDRFGESGPGAQVAEHLGLTVDALAALLKTVR